MTLSPEVQLFSACWGCLVTHQGLSRETECRCGQVPPALLRQAGFLPPAAMSVLCGFTSLVGAGLLGTLRNENPGHNFTSVGKMYIPEMTENFLMAVERAVTLCPSPGGITALSP